MATDMGGWSETKDATEETQTICDQVKDQVEKQTGKNYRVYKAVKYRDLHLCGGTHYLIKVDVGEDYDHLMVVQVTGTRIPSPPSLSGVEQHKTKDEPLVLFTN
ncbi:stefin-C-like isoform X1 [Epinephelus fuscoguttatus]|uniref:stefin-C-like isoform X1 n=1 Tax=Epinephelus fuscoguttatus TaxID=293821 RepID=UPI0020D1E4E7|nr:stefin-C-like isoform X1 [Epinephelus fuscoguttatus]